MLFDMEGSWVLCLFFLVKVIFVPREKQDKARLGPISTERSRLTDLMEEGPTEELDITTHRTGTSSEGPIHCRKGH